MSHLRNITAERPTNTHISAVRERTRGESPGSYASAKDREAQEIASDILAKLDNPEILDAGQIAQLRAEVQRRVSERELQQAEQAELDQLRLIVAMREAA